MVGPDREDVEREGTPRIRTVDDIADTDAVHTTEEIYDTEDILTDEEAGDVERDLPPRGAPPLGPGYYPPPEDEEVNPVGSYETWDQTGASLDAAGAGMTGDAGSVGLTGTGFEDDADLGRRE